MRYYKQTWYIAIQVGIVFENPGFNVKFTVTKNTGQLLELGLRY
jgi:hypothetical protein